MIFDQIRQDIETYFRAVWESKYPDYEWVTENSKFIDLSEQVQPFLTSEIRFTGNSQQVTINGDNPITRFLGVVVFRAFVREGEGDKIANGMLDFISNTLAYRQAGGVLFKHPVPMPSGSEFGWRKKVLRMPIQVDTLRQP